MPPPSSRHVPPAERCSAVASASVATCATEHGVLFFRTLLFLLVSAGLKQPFAIFLLFPPFCFLFCVQFLPSSRTRSHALVICFLSVVPLFFTFVFTLAAVVVMSTLCCFASAALLLLPVPASFVDSPYFFFFTPWCVVFPSLIYPLPLLLVKPQAARRLTLICVLPPPSRACGALVSGAAVRRGVSLCLLFVCVVCLFVCVLLCVLLVPHLLLSFFRQACGFVSASPLRPCVRVHKSRSGHGPN